ncbi:MAG: hypothetical protein NT105_07300 [Verrucomicrobia bacterium]|nr:hypothetical protein [Verrucomicrobiota bacterium]
MRLIASLVVAPALAAAVCAAPSIEQTPVDLRVTAPGYRAKFQRHNSEFDLELRDAKGAWRRVARKFAEPEFAVLDDVGLQTTAGLLARVEHTIRGDAVVVGMTVVISPEPRQILQLHFICADEGVLVRFALDGKVVSDKARCWAMPRLPLDEPLFNAYAFWREPDEFRGGTIAKLGRNDAFAGASAWGQRGDTAARLSRRHPAVIARAAGAGTGVGVVFLRYAEDWQPVSSFVQRHTPTSLFLYPAIAPARATANGLWAWLAPFTESEPAQMAAKVERLVARGEELRREFRPVAPEPDPRWLKPAPNFPAALRRQQPVTDIRDAVVYTVHETMDADYGIRAGAKAGSDCWIRAWFKWNQARDYAAMAHLVPKAHALGALFGGGITCSALYHGENGLTETQVLDMATRGPDGKLVDAWAERNCRHGTLSNPAYLEYLLSWCRRQIDAGADYLFMDEINAALQANEGFDDYSLRDYRAWLEKRGLSFKPPAPGKPPVEWHAFRRDRDDRAWKWLTDAIRSYAASKGRCVLISGNGLARYVDLQVLGVWGLWRVKDGAVDLSENQIIDWASTVAAGRALAGKRVPVVFFHDWGFNGFPWMEVPPPNRELWIRVRGAEIYAAGAFFAFPVHGPMGNDALRDGTIHEVARQTAFYQRNKALYLDARLLGFEPIETNAPLLSTALWRRDGPPALLLHVINRQAKDTKPVRRANVEITLPTANAPKAVRIVSPDWDGEQQGETRIKNGRVVVTLPSLDAYAVAILDYDALPEVKIASLRTVPTAQWGRPERSEFVVERDGTVRDAWALPAFLQGNLHAALREPPTFLVNMPRGGKLNVHVRAVATLGAKLECLMDGTLTQTVDFPDLDGKNDSSAREYDKTFEFAVPPGRHRVMLRNNGGDWAYVAWYAFAGETGGW